MTTTQRTLAGVVSKPLTTDRDLFKELYPGLRRYAAVVGSTDMDPDDLVQEALVRTLERQRLIDLENPGAYLRRTIVTVASNQRRRLGVRRRLRPVVAQRDRVDQVYPSDLGELSRLAPMDRAVLYLADVEGRPFVQVAAMTGLTEQAARLRASRARRQLRTALDQPENKKGKQ